MNKTTFSTLLILSIFLGNISFSQTFTLKSKDLGGQFTNRNFNNGFGCAGENKSPQLYWENPPKGTVSYAITMYDKDAPTGSGFWHWVVYNIPPNISEFKEDMGNSVKPNLPPQSVCGINDAGIFGYVGPCPPEGQNHLYLITIYALKTNLTLDKNASAALVGFMLNANCLSKASIAIYGQR